MTSAARWGSNHASGDKVSEATVRCVDRREFGNRATAIRRDHFFAGLPAIDVPAETILQVADPDLRPRSSYVHTISAATSAATVRAAVEAPISPGRYDMADELTAVVRQS